MHDTRQAVLQTIKTQGRATVASLAEALSLTTIAVRHHLTGLQGEGLVQVELERQHVGRPRHIYTLTEAAQRYFPNQYHVLVDRLLSELKATLGPSQVEMMIDRLAANVAAKYGHQGTRGETMEARVEHLITVMGEEGFMTAVEKIDDKTLVTQLNCPYMFLGQTHPEVCRIDQAIMETVLGVDVQQTSCVLHGDHNCTFSLKDAAEQR
jgi:predicted ArsR family transcriptional regulator